MMYRAIILVLLFLSNVNCMSQGAKDIDNLCSDISISTRLKNWRVMEGKKKYVESGKWDEYDENGALKRIPALLDVVLDIDKIILYEA